MAAADTPVPVPAPASSPLGFLVPVATALVNEECATTLLVDLDVLNGPCLKLSLSKALGFAIILGAVFLKVPHIVNCFRSKSTEGMPLVAQLQELAAFTITIAYNVNDGNPFSTWGEGLFINIQNLVLTLMIFAYANQNGRLVAFLAAYCAAMAWLLSGMVPRSVLVTLMSCVIPMNVVGRSLIILNAVRTKSTGQLSIITQGLQVAGGLARVFTTLQEVDDGLILFGCLAGLSTNLIIFILVLVYGAAKTKATKAD